MARQWDDPAQTDREETASPELARLLFIAIGVAMLIGLVCGVVWTAYHLLKGYFAG
jgi:hypothetical protein